MGYKVNKIRLHSMEDNKTYNIDIPEKNILLKDKFDKLIRDMHEFKFENFKQTNRKKCEKCIYEPSCDRSLIC